MTRCEWRSAGFTLTELLVTVSVVAVLGAAVVPATVASKELARRQACRSQLGQVAKGMASYCADYSQYLPSWPGWGKPVHAPLKKGLGVKGQNACTENGVYPDRAAGKRARVYTAVPDDNYYPYVRWNVPPKYFRTIFCGNGKRTGGKLTAAKAGQLSMGPIGLGNLVVTGYLADVGALYCPSSDGMPSEGFDYKRGGGRPFNAGACVRLADAKKSGGLDGRAMTHGDWNWLKMWASAYSPVRAVLSHYSYRMVPSEVHAEGNDPDSARMLYTRPGRVVKDGEPVFKTQKQLANRTLAADAFHKTGNCPAANPGMGWWGHKEGYNVLYGDGRVRWYSDPEEGILYWPGIAPYSTDGMRMGMGNNVICDFQEGAKAPVKRRGAVKLWHLLDLVAGVDVGIDEYSH